METLLASSHQALLAMGLMRFTGENGSAYFWQSSTRPLGIAEFFPIEVFPWAAPAVNEALDAD